MTSLYEHFLFFTGKNELTGVQLFQELYRRQDQAGGEGVVPDFITSPSTHFFYISIDDGVVYFSSANGPAIKELDVIAERLDLDFKLEYHSWDIPAYGKYIRTDGVGVDYRLDNDDLTLYSYDEELDVYRFKGHIYNFEMEVFEELFKQKFGDI